MDVFTAISDRRSIRKYKEKDVERSKLDRILEAGRISPSAGNRQEWKFIVVKDKGTREALVDAAKGQQFVGEAPIVIVACAMSSDYVMACGQYSYTIDLSIAMAYMILEAWELGLGTCWLGAFYEDKVKAILGIPDGVRVVAMTPLGYPDESPGQRPRNKIEQIVSYEKY